MNRLQEVHDGAYEGCAFSPNCDSSMIEVLGNALLDLPHAPPTPRAPEDWTGWYQVSHHHRHVARLPAGKSGVQALIEAADAERISPWMSAAQRAEAHWANARWANGLGEASAGDQFLRVYAEGLGLVRWLSREEFDEFKSAGGSTYR